jgi:hypothetical protein
VEHAAAGRGRDRGQARFFSAALTFLASFFSLSVFSGFFFSDFFASCAFMMCLLGLDGIRVVGPATEGAVTGRKSVARRS